MKELRIKLTPLEPYFFGGERIFEINDSNKHYFIRSLKYPSQTTLFGVLRYLGIKNFSKGFCLDADDIKNIGESSFSLEESKKYGKINKISPLYIMDEEEKIYIHTPFDCQRESVKKDTKSYTPFEKYSESVLTSNGWKRFPREYDAKKGIADSWLSLSSLETKGDLFSEVVRVGINKDLDENAFVKKAFKRLKEGFSFVFYAFVEDDFEISKERVVYVGHGKSAFRAEVTETNGNEHKGWQDKVKKIVSPNMVYAQSDIYVSQEKVSDIYQQCEFVCVKIRNFRNLTTRIAKTDVRARYERAKKTTLLIQAGSVFKPHAEGKEKFVEQISKNGIRSETAGFNQIIIGGVKNEEAHI